MTPYQRQKIIESHNDAYKRHGFHPNALLWSNQEVQEMRFKILSEIGIQGDDQVLDVGCGFGEFAMYLQKQGHHGTYTGIDLSEELIREGRRQFPEIKLYAQDLFEFDPAPNSFDYVTLSGTLNRKYDGSEEDALSVIKRMFEAARKGVAFNLLDARHEWTSSRWDLQSFDPNELLTHLDRLTSDYKIIDHYLVNDFTVYLVKKGLNKSLGKD